MTAGIRRLLREEKGASVVELGLVAPLIAMLFMGMVDTGSGISHKLMLEQAAQRSVEKASVFGSAGADFSDIDDEAAAAAGVPVQDVTVDQWLECDGVRQDNFDDVCNNGEQIARYISVSIADTYDPYFTYGPIGTWVGVNDNGELPITVDAEVRIQ